MKKLPAFAAILAAISVIFLSVTGMTSARAASGEVVITHASMSTSTIPLWVAQRQNFFHGSQTPPPGFNQALGDSGHRTAVHLRSEFQTHRRPFQNLQHFFDSDALRWARQHIPARRASDRVNQMTTA